MARLLAIMVFLMPLLLTDVSHAAGKLITLADNLVVNAGATDLPPLDVHAYSEVAILAIANTSGGSISAFFMDTNNLASDATPKIYALSCTINDTQGAYSCTPPGGTNTLTFKVAAPFLSLQIATPHTLTVSIKIWAIK